MGCGQRLDKSFQEALILPLENDSRYVLFSDCHRGNGTHNDNFLRNQHLYFAALTHYYQAGYTYIELGDGDELWENRNMKQIIEIHSDVFWQLSRFYQKKRLYMIYGNHDICKKGKRFARQNCSSYFCTTAQHEEPLFPDITFHEGMILRNEESDVSLYLTHGHQASLLNSTFWPLGRFLVRYIWKPLEQIGFLDPTSAAKNYPRQQATERKLSSWAKKNDHMLVTGHTHRPMIDSSDSHYFNVGSCVHPRCITCIEISCGKLRLVKWYVGIGKFGNLVVKSEELSIYPLTLPLKEALY